jgi:hypothetical protein
VSLPWKVRGGLTFDTGALIALDRDDRRMWLVLRTALAEGGRPVVPTPVIAQAWRSARQVRLARAVRLCRKEDVDEELAKAAGALCAASKTDDAIDAIVVASAARRGDRVLTADPGDIARLADHVAGVRVVPL